MLDSSPWFSFFSSFFSNFFSSFGFVIAKMKFSTLFAGAVGLVGFVAAGKMPGPNFLPLHIYGGLPFSDMPSTPVVRPSTPCTTLRTETKPVETGVWPTPLFPLTQDEVSSSTSWDFDYLPAPTDLDFTPRLPITTEADFDVLPLPTDEPEIWMPTVLAEGFASNSIALPLASKTTGLDSEHTTLQTVAKA